MVLYLFLRMDDKCLTIFTMTMLAMMMKMSFADIMALAMSTS